MVLLNISIALYKHRTVQKTNREVPAPRSLQSKNDCDDKEQNKTNERGKKEEEESTHKIGGNVRKKE